MSEEPTREDALKKLMASTGMSKAEAIVRLAESTKTAEETEPPTE